MRKILLLSAFAAASTVTFAQKASLGVRAGLSAAGMRGDAVSSFNSMIDFANGMITTQDRTGFFAGTYATVPLGNVISIEPALYFAQKGYALRGDLKLKGAAFLGANAEAKLNTQYVDLPVLLKASLGGFEVFAGPQISYLVNAGLHTTAGVLGINLLNSKIDATNQFNRWDAALTGGIGYKFANGFNVMGSYDHGLSKVDANGSLNSYNSAFKLGVGMSF